MHIVPLNINITHRENKWKHFNWTHNNRNDGRPALYAHSSLNNEQPNYWCLFLCFFFAFQKFRLLAKQCCHCRWSNFMSRYEWIIVLYFCVLDSRKNGKNDTCNRVTIRTSYCLKKLNLQQGCFIYKIKWQWNMGTLRVVKVYALCVPISYL